MHKPRRGTPTRQAESSSPSPRQQQRRDGPSQLPQKHDMSNKIDVSDMSTTAFCAPEGPTEGCGPRTSPHGGRAAQEDVEVCWEITLGPGLCGVAGFIPDGGGKDTSARPGAIARPGAPCGFARSGAIACWRPKPFFFFFGNLCLLPRTRHVALPSLP